jgi:D-alanyl-D-alanine carboxypeptidase/D-alanyl-D-alanine-endopeptidase (penicillin-binding protein 4)
MKNQNNHLHTRIFLSILILFNACALFAQNPAALTAFLQKENLSHAAVGLKVVDLKTGKTLVSYNEKVALTPASNMKIVTTATALDILGEGFFFETPLFYDGVIENSQLKGDLYIQGSGDPTLGSEYIGEKESFLKTWLTALDNAGIKSISGDIIVLDQLFGYEGVSPKWMLEDLGNYYASGIYGISVFDNLCRVYIQSFAPGTDTKILYTEPHLDLLLTNEIKADESKSDESNVFGLPFSNERRLYGSIPANRASFAVKSDIPDPGLLLSQYFLAFLQNHGIEVNGTATTYRLNPKLPQAGIKIGAAYSHDLTSIVREINVRSNNHYVDHLYKLLTLSMEIDIPAYWKTKKLDSNALFMFDGSGLSPSNGLSTGFLIDILVYMDKKYGKSGAFYKSLPLAGKEGTVTSLLKNTVLEGKAHLKSGSITNVQSYSGYIEKDDNRYAVSLIINQFTGKRADLRKSIEQLFVGLF